MPAKNVVDAVSPSNVGALEKVLKNGNATVVLIFASWCGPCKNFRKNIWNPMCNKKAKHNRVAIESNVLGETSLKNVEVNSFPTMLFVDENGSMQTFKTPEGTLTHSMPIPQSLGDMERIANVSLKPLSKNTRKNTVRRVRNNNLRNNTLKNNKRTLNFNNRNNVPHYSIKNLVSLNTPKSRLNKNTPLNIFTPDNKNTGLKEVKKFD